MVVVTRGGDLFGAREVSTSEWNFSNMMLKERSKVSDLIPISLLHQK